MLCLSKKSLSIVKAHTLYVIKCQETFAGGAKGPGPLVFELKVTFVVMSLSLAPRGGQDNIPVFFNNFISISSI